MLFCGAILDRAPLSLQNCIPWDTLMIEHYEIELYVTKSGETPFSKWLSELKDLGARAKIRVRLDRLKLGNFGDCKVLGDGVSELKVNLGPGYRVYFGKSGRLCVLLLCAGSKKTQERDIERAKEFWHDFVKRGKANAKK